MYRVTSTTCVLLASAMVIVGCDRQGGAAQHTVAEYQSDPNLRREQFARCATDPGTLAKTPDCINARQAQHLEDLRSVRDTPPVGLLPHEPRGK